MEFEFKLDIDTTKLKALQRDIKVLNKRHIRYGWLKNKMHPNAQVPIAQVANWQEFGVPATEYNVAIPARPYFRQAVNKVRYGYYNDIKHIFIATLEGRDVDSHLNFLAENLRTAYGNSIASQNHKALAPYTVKLKGHKYQMFDSGVMINSFESKVYRQGIGNIKVTP